jgi:hypothetical protein
LRYHFEKIAVMSLKAIRHAHREITRRKASAVANQPVNFSQDNTPSNVCGRSLLFKFPGRTVVGRSVVLLQSGIDGNTVIGYSGLEHIAEMPLRALPNTGARRMTSSPMHGILADKPEHDM